MNAGVVKAATVNKPCRSHSMLLAIRTQHGSLSVVTVWKGWVQMRIQRKVYERLEFQIRRKRGIRGFDTARIHLFDKLTDRLTSPHG